MRAWTKTRHAPALAPQSFKDWWRSRNLPHPAHRPTSQTSPIRPTHAPAAHKRPIEAPTSRELILARIEEALSDSTPAPFEATAAQKRAVLPAVHDLVPQFAANAEFLRAEFYACADEATAKAKLAELAAKHGWKKIATHRGTLTQAVSPTLPTLDATDGYDRFELETCDAGITECDALIAQTGSVFLTARSGGGRALSVLPEHHVVLARRDQLLPDLPAGFELIQQRYGSQWPSLTTLITGPSCTGDIERIIILGAHGPKKLTIVMW
jgi:L-lactate dehydrogenase complex protein LldG